MNRLLIESNEGSLVTRPPFAFRLSFVDRLCFSADWTWLALTWRIPFATNSHSVSPLLATLRPSTSRRSYGRSSFPRIFFTSLCLAFETSFSEIGSFTTFWTLWRI